MSFPISEPLVEEFILNYYCPSDESTSNNTIE
jgi:hypothetical protein